MQVSAPYGWAFQSLVEMETGPKESAPSIVVLLLPRQSADPPQSSGRTGARALIAAPDALRVATPSIRVRRRERVVQPSGRMPSCRRENSSKRSGSLVAQASISFCHCARILSPRSTTRRACASTSGSTSKLLSGSKPRARLTPATSSAPSAAPCTPPVFIFFGAGKPMTVRSRMIEGRSPTALAASAAARIAETSSPPSTTCTCQPYASYRVATSSPSAMAVSSSMEILLSS